MTRKYETEDHQKGKEKKRREHSEAVMRLLGLLDTKCLT